MCGIFGGCTRQVGGYTGLQRYVSVSLCARMYGECKGECVIVCVDVQRMHNVCVFVWGNK